MKRPYPNKHLGTLANGFVKTIEPADELNAWVMDNYLRAGAPMFNKDHEHLYDHIENGSIRFLWAAGAYVKQGRVVLGLTEEVTFRCGAWQKLRHVQQMDEWFGMVPDYLITLDAGYCDVCSDIEFCALVDHELSHIGQALDMFGSPKFHRDTGLPVLTMRGHDIEEFIGVVKRYGANEGVMELVKAAQGKPTVSRLNVAQACGTCLKGVA